MFSSCLEERRRNAMLFKLACRSDNMADKQPRVEEGGFRDRVRKPKESEKAYLSPSQHSNKKKGCVWGEWKNCTF